MFKLLRRKRALMHAAVAIIVVAASIGTIMSVQAEEIDRTSCGTEFITFYWDADGDTFGNPDITIDACSVTAESGYVSNDADCDDTDADIHPGAAEMCDGEDNNCNGGVDEDLDFLTYYLDADGDGFGLLTSTTSACALPLGYAEEAGDCNDNNATVFPGAVELCDGLDNNCDGGIDEELDFLTYYLDADGDGFGLLTSTTSACALPADYAEKAGDCNDADAAVNPDATEVCNDNIDNNCDGLVDTDCESDEEGDDEEGNGGDYGYCPCDSACVCTCAEGAPHGHYVSSIAHCANQLVRAGLISGREKGQMVSQAARSKHNENIGGETAETKSESKLVKDKAKNKKKGNKN